MGNMGLRVLDRSEGALLSILNIERMILYAEGVKVLGCRAT
jgi:hypothetical protein